MKPTFRASETDRTLNCHGSITLVPLVAPREGDEGVEGTAIHNKIGWRLVHELGATHNGFPANFCYTPSGHVTDWLVNFCFNAVKERTPDGWSLEIEMALSYEWDRFILSGHPDVVAISPDVTEFDINDFKAGYIPVDIAEMNWQLLTYAVLLKRAYPTLQRGHLRIIQPRNDEEEGQPRISTVVIDDLDAATALLEKRINAAIDNATKEVNSGMTQCKWCPVGIQCPALQQDKELMKVMLTAEAIGKIKREPDDALLGDWVISMRTLKRPTDDAEDLLHARLAKTGAVNAGCGVQITRKIQGGSYSIPEPAKFFAAMRELLPDEDSLVKVMKPSVTAIKDELAAVMKIPKTGKAPVTAEGVFDAKLRPLVERGERKIFVFN